MKNMTHKNLFATEKNRLFLNCAFQFFGGFPKSIYTPMGVVAKYTRCLRAIRASLGLSCQRTR